MSCRQGETRSKKDNKSESIANTNQTTTTTTTAAAPNKAALIKREARSCPALAKSRIPVYNNNHHHLNPHRQSRCSTPKCPPSPFRCASSAGFCTATATTSAAAAAVAAATFLPALPDHIKALHKIHNINQHTSEQRFIQRSVTHQHLFETRKPSSMPSTSTSSRGATTPTNRNRSDSQATTNGQQQQNQRNDNGWSGNRKKLYYAEYLPLCEIQKGLAKGEIVEGILRINPKSYNDAYISAPDGGLDIYIKGFADRNRSLNGDLVAVELFDDSKWTVSYSAINANYEKWGNDFEALLKRKESNLAADLSRLSLSSQDFNKLKMSGNGAIGLVMGTLRREFSNLPEQLYNLTIGDLKELSFCYDFIQRTGKVVHIKEMNHTRIAGGTMKLNNGPNAELVSVDLRVPRVLVPRESLPRHFVNNFEQLRVNLFLVKITKWSQTSLYPFGQIVKHLGDPRAIDNENELLLTTNGVDSSEFPASALKEYEQFMGSGPNGGTKWTIPEEEFAKREDIRDCCVFTIDPQSARDLDDAISIDLNTDDTIEVGVHIADVAYFIKEDTELNNIAQRRATSVYLPNKVIPMLPPLFCQNLCSLTAGEDKLSFSVFFTFDLSYNILSRRFSRTVMRSCTKLSYEHAQKMMYAESEDLNPEEFPEVHGKWSVREIAFRIKSLLHVTSFLRQQRFENGSLRIAKTKLSFMLDDDGLPICFSKYVLNESNFLIEELMLLANRAVAERIYELYGATGQTFLRNHVPPGKYNLNEFMNYCKAIKVDFDVTNAKTIQQSLDKLKDMSPDQFKLISLQLVKSMKLATYIQTSHTEHIKVCHHYALNFDLYTHFTSPIRRFADLVVHRLLAASLPEYKKPVTIMPAQLRMIADNCNQKKQAAMIVSEMSAEIYLRAYISRLSSVDVNVVVAGVYDHSFDVLISDFDLIKRIYLERLPLKSQSFCKQNGVPRLYITWKAIDNGTPLERSLDQTIENLSMFKAQVKVIDRKMTVLIAHPNGDFIDTKAK